MEHPTLENPSNTEVSSPTIAHQLLYECEVMVRFAARTGITLKKEHLTVLDEKKGKLKVSDVLPTYNYLIEQVKPVSPGTLILIEENKNSKSILKSLGPVPIIQHFMLVSLACLIAMISLSFFGDLNVNTVQLSMLQGSGWGQVHRLGFLTACAGVGASFFALFKMNNFIKAGTFDIKHNSTYWSRFVLGIVAGLLLSEMFVVFIEPTNYGNSASGPMDNAKYLLKPILAILGGFSANLVHRVLSRLVETVEQLFKGSANEVVAQKEKDLMLQNESNLNKVRVQTANNLLSLKQTLMDHDISPDALAKVDEALGKVTQQD